MKFLIFLSLFTFPMVSYAYLDPGTGSFIVQAILAALAGLIFSIKIFWYRIKTFGKKVFLRISKGENNRQES